MPRGLSQVILESVKLTTSIKHHNNEPMSRTTRILSLIFQMRSLGLREIDSLAKSLREAVCLTVMVVWSDSKDPKLPPWTPRMQVDRGHGYVIRRPWHGQLVWRGGDSNGECRTWAIHGTLWPEEGWDDSLTAAGLVPGNRQEQEVEPWESINLTRENICSVPFRMVSHCYLYSIGMCATSHNLLEPMAPQITQGLQHGSNLMLGCVRPKF